MSETGKKNDEVDCPECGVQNIPCEKCKKVKPNCPECLTNLKEGYCPDHKRPFDTEDYLNLWTKFPSWGVYPLIGLILVVILTPLIFIAINHIFIKFGKEDLELIGALGDSYGGLNALFSALAFAGLIYTVLLQRKELSLQRLEVSETRKELKKGAEAQEKTATYQEKLTNLEAYSILLRTYTDSIKSIDEQIIKLKENFAEHPDYQQFTPSGPIPDYSKIKEALDKNKTVIKKREMRVNLENLQISAMTKIQTIVRVIEENS